MTNSTWAPLPSVLCRSKSKPIRLIWNDALRDGRREAVAGADLRGRVIHLHPALREALVARMSRRRCWAQFGHSVDGCDITDESQRDTGDHVSYREWGILEDESMRPLLLPVLRSPLIRRVMSGLIAPDYVLHGCTAYVAAPSASGKENTWHYDFDYQIPEFRLAARTALAAQRSHYAAAMLRVGRRCDRRRPPSANASGRREVRPGRYLQDADASNGATRIVKGSHHWPARDPPFLPPGQFLDVHELVAAWDALRDDPRPTTVGGEGRLSVERRTFARHERLVPRRLRAAHRSRRRGDSRGPPPLLPGGRASHHGRLQARAAPGRRQRLALRIRRPEAFRVL